MALARSHEMAAELRALGIEVIEVHSLVRRADVTTHGLQLLNDEHAVGQRYAIGDPTLRRE